MEHVPGMSIEFRFGGTSGQGDRFGVCLYGNVGHPAAQWAMDGACAQHPRQAALAENQMWHIWFRFEPRVYGEVWHNFGEVLTLIKAADWTSAPAIDGVLGISNSIDEMVTDDHFEDEPLVHGFNAARGFSIVVEKLGMPPIFSKEEIAAVRDLAVKASVIVFGHELPEMV